jgi:hypothetical protein
LRILSRKDRWPARSGRGELDFGIEAGSELCDGGVKFDVGIVVGKIAGLDEFSGTVDMQVLSFLILMVLR